EQVQLDHVNHPFNAPTRSVKEIVRSNIVTPFNILNFVLAIIVIIASVAKPSLIVNLTFMGVVISNIFISIVQELRAKKTIDKLAILTQPTVTVVRDGDEQEISVNDLVIGDVMKLTSGNQISVDATFIQGSSFEVDESLLTGESDNIVKKPADVLYSGSVVMAGIGYARVTQVGANTVPAKISLEAKQERKKPSLILDSLNRIIKILSVIMIPVGLALFISSYSKAAAGDLPGTVVSVVAALIGMIPEGLMLLTSIAFAVGVVNLGKRKLLVQTLPSIEALARVDTLCLDKTGTITNGEMDVHSYYVFSPTHSDRFIDLNPDEELDAPTEDHIAKAKAICQREQVDPATQARANLLFNGVAAMVKDQESRNTTATALLAFFDRPPLWHQNKVVPFSSKRKWSGVSYQGQGTFVMGAPEFVLQNNDFGLFDKINTFADKGYRVLAVAYSPAPFGPNDELPENIVPLGVVTLVDQLRENVRETLNYFSEQGVTIKVISGDNPRTVSAVARNAGVAGADNWLDMSEVPADTDLTKLVDTYTLFGRVTPFQKRLLLQALQARGHVVAMTGDGVNDVLALKEADCSVAMAAGSDAARSSADLVLLENDIDSMVYAVYEGRRVINNIERVATLFLVKTVYSCLLSFLYIFLPFAYPLLPIQISLISSFTIGIPSFVLALKPNRERVKGNFLGNIIRRSLPGGITSAIMIVISQLIGYLINLGKLQNSTLAVLILASMGLLILLQVSRPLDAMRRALFIFCIGGILGAILFFPRFFFLASLISPLFWLYTPLLAATYGLYTGIRGIGRALRFQLLRNRRRSDDKADRRKGKSRRLTGKMKRSAVSPDRQSTRANSTKRSPGTAKMQTKSTAKPPR
ncbi:MAG TPA: HAD-IC family P-type ATPase, partial [Clostridiaceae bacterium]|nr:HAD-IC family P-type ATPase [Clostridiaceae bacterium]